MIKRRFYRDEHGDKDEPSSSSSSSSDDDGIDNRNDSEAEADASQESDDNAQALMVKGNYISSSSSSGYESEDRSAEEFALDSSGFLKEDDETGSDKETNVGSRFPGKQVGDMLKEKIKANTENGFERANMEDFVLKFKSVYRCRLCPRIVCLSEETMKTHLSSKRHKRSEKLLKENRLKAMLNSDGEIENQETPAEMHARIMAHAESTAKKKNKGRQRQKKRSRNKKGQDVSSTEKAKEPVKIQAKKRRKSND